MTSTPEPIDALVRRFDPDPDRPADITRVSLAAVLAGGDDPLKIVAYMAGLGIAVRELDDLLKINADETEEELHAFRVAEGIALSVASDGLWLLYVP